MGGMKVIFPHGLHLAPLTQGCHGKSHWVSAIQHCIFVRHIIYSFFFFFSQFGFRKWKAHVTERPIEDQSDLIKELYSDLTVVKPREGLLKKKKKFVLLK